MGELDDSLSLKSIPLRLKIDGYPSSFPSCHGLRSTGNEFEIDDMSNCHGVLATRLEMLHQLTSARDSHWLSSQRNWPVDLLIISTPLVS